MFTLVRRLASGNVTSTMGESQAKDHVSESARSNEGGRCQDGSDGQEREYSSRLPTEKRQRMLRVDHAGEYGAVRIYEGQLAALGRTSEREKLEEMAEHEREHLRAFESMLPSERARPTLLLPAWHVAGFALGAGSGLLGKEASHRVTKAVEEVISDHYDRQAREASEEGDDYLSSLLARFRDDELEHRDTAEERGAHYSPFPSLIDALVKRGCKVAIWASERI